MVHSSSGTSSRRRGGSRHCRSATAAWAAWSSAASCSEQIQFNEETVWTGHPREYQHAGAVALPPEIRSLLAGREAGRGRNAGDAGIHERAAPADGLSAVRRRSPRVPRSRERANYTKRSLDLDEAVVRVGYEVDGVHFERQVFSSYPDQVLVIRLAADQNGKVGFRATMDSPHAGSATRVRARRPGRPLGTGRRGGRTVRSPAAGPDRRGLNRRGRREIIVDSMPIRRP